VYKLYVESYFANSVNEQNAPPRRHRQRHAGGFLQAEMLGKAKVWYTAFRAKALEG
jgi:hypothetical protein